MTASSMHSGAEDHRDASADSSAARQWLSALADGEEGAVPPAMAAWRDDPLARESWHLYHLIGDVLRSDDLAAAPARDAAFLAQVRTRLAAEPVPLAPAALAPLTPAPAAGRWRRLGWRAPSAVAAGFAAVAASLVLLRPSGGPAPAGAELAGVGAVGPGLAAQRVAQPGLGAAASGEAGWKRPLGAPGLLVNDGRMMRDAELDAYLRAHQAARGALPAALPGGGLRNVEILVTPAATQAVPAPGGSSAAASRNASGQR